MSGALVGYARVSTKEQDPGSQENALREAGATRIFVDHGESSRKVDRPQWLACLDYLRAGDTLMVWRLDRLTGTEKMAIETINDLHAREVEIRSLMEPAIDTTTAMGRALWGFTAVLAQLRVDQIRENTRAGLARARAEGRVGGRPTVMTPERIKAAVRLRHQEDMSLDDIAPALGVARSSVSRALAQLDDNACKVLLGMSALEEDVAASVAGSPRRAAFPRT